jgi:Kef-type K+ transport system membrane component KefB
MEIVSSINSILSLGMMLLFGFASAGFIRNIKMPSITAYLLLGIVLGPSLTNLISNNILVASGLISNVVLSFIAFSIGQNFSRERFRELGRTVISISLAEGLGAAIIVGLSMYFIAGKPLFVALCFAAIAPATAPAAVLMVVREFRAKGRFTDTLLAVVALDDSWGLMIFALLLAIAKSMVGAHGAVLSTAFSGILHGIIEIVGALILGGIMGRIMSKFSEYLHKQSELLIYTLGFILLNAGLSLYLGVSVLLSNMAMATILVNVNKTSFKFFDSIRNMDAPFYLIFFVLAGANLEIGIIKTLGVIGVIYIIARMAGKIIGVFFSAQIVGASKQIRNFLGIGLAPQAGVALGMAMIVKHLFPVEGGYIMSTIIATTVLYEIFGPILTKIALQSSGDIE